MSRNSSNPSNSSYSCLEEVEVNKTILGGLPKCYKDTSVRILCSVITICKEYYDEYATCNDKTLSSCPAPDSVIKLLQNMGNDKQKELHDLVLHCKFAALVYHGKLEIFISTLPSKLTFTHLLFNQPRMAGSKMDD